MGIDTVARIIVGLPYAEIIGIEEEDLDDLLNDGDIEYISPYYDAPRDASVYGIILLASSYGDIVEFNITNEEIETAKDAFRTLCNCEPKVYLSANVW